MAQATVTAANMEDAESTDFGGLELLRVVADQEREELGSTGLVAVHAEVLDPMDHTIGYLVYYL